MLSSGTRKPKSCATTEQEDPLESQAIDAGIAYVKLDGDVGCLVNGAGLAMATMDVIKGAGMSPANFLDVGGGASVEKVAQACRLMLSDPSVTRVLVNVFGGILRCDIAAAGVVQAFRETNSQLPIFVRMLGHQCRRGLCYVERLGLGCDLLAIAVGSGGGFDRFKVMQGTGRT